MGNPSNPSRILSMGNPPTSGNPVGTSDRRPLSGAQMTDEYNYQDMMNPSQGPSSITTRILPMMRDTDRPVYVELLTKRHAFFSPA